MQTFTITCDDGVILRGHKHAGAGGPALLCIHGWMADSRVFDDVLAPLTRTYSVFTIDLRGAGQSDKPASGYTLERYTKDLVAVLDGIDATQVVLVGHSMGGQLTQRLLALGHPKLRGGVALCPVPLSGAPLPADAVPLFAHAGGNKDSLNTILGLACKQITPVAQSRLLACALAIPKACIDEGFAAWSAGDGQTDLGRIALPLVVVGSDDPFLPSAFLQQAVVDRINAGHPGAATLAHIAGAGHYPQVERPDETTRVLAAALMKVCGA